MVVHIHIEFDSTELYPNPSPSWPLHIIGIGIWPDLLTTNSLIVRLGTEKVPFSQDILWSKVKMSQ